MNTFSIRESLGAGWRIVRGNLKFFVLFALILLAVSILADMPELLGGEAEEGILANIFAGLFVLLSSVLSFIVSVWTFQIGLNAVDGKKLSFNGIVPTWPVAWRYLLASLLLVLIIGVPAMLVGIFIAPVLAFAAVIIASLATSSVLAVMLAWVILGGVFIVVAAAFLYFSARLMFAPYFIIDSLAGPISSIRMSWELTRGSGWHLVLFSLAITLVSILGVALLFVGLLIALPVSLVAMAYVFRQLQKKAPVPVLEAPKEVVAEAEVIREEVKEPKKENKGKNKKKKKKRK